MTLDEGVLSAGKDTMVLLNNVAKGDNFCLQRQQFCSIIGQ